MCAWKITHIRNNPDDPCAIDSAVVTGNVPSPGTYFFDCPNCVHTHRVDIGTKAGTSVNSASIVGAELYQCYVGTVRRNPCNQLSLTNVYVTGEDTLLAGEKAVRVQCDHCHDTHQIAVDNWITPTEIPNNAVFGEIVDINPIVN